VSRLRWLLALVPLAAGAVAAVLLSQAAPIPIVYLRVDQGTLAIAAGLLGAAVVAAILAAQEWRARGRTEAAGEAQALAIEERRRFVQRLDHELKNPLTAIRAGLANVAGAETERAALDSVNAQVARIARLTADLRKLSELEGRPLESAPVDMGELLATAWELAQEKPEAGDRHLGLTLPRAPWPLPPVAGDRDLLLLAVYNLLDNALKFTRPGDTVELRASEDGTAVVVEVADTGPGILEEDLPHVWEELYRGDQARGIPGSGLGLALVRAIVERHHGTIAVRSRAGQGTVFTVRLTAGPGVTPREAD
jgi:two-component system OmpR family sensor kinase